MQNAAFKEMGVDAVYKTFPLEEDELPAFMEELRGEANPIFGFNVTVPYKETIVQYMDSLSPLVEKIQAVNTVLVTPQRKLIGYNTDAPGFMAHMSELNYSVEGKNIAILGAGGSARAIVAVLCLLAEKPNEIKIYNRTSSRMDQMLEDLGQRIDMSCVTPVISIDDLDLSSADMLINTTSVGLNSEDPCLVDSDLIHSKMFVYDLIYNPAETILLKMAKLQDAKTANGLGMLFYQGVLSLQHWAGVQLEQHVKNVMREALESAAWGADFE